MENIFEFERVKNSFNKQGLMQTFNAQLAEVKTGYVKIICHFSEGLTQHHGFFHAGVITALADNACGFAALTMMPGNTEVLTVEFKVNFLRPAKATKLVAVGRVLQSGKTLTVCDGFVHDEREEKLIAKMAATMIAVTQDK
jgi:uncharacterized protein (TIGR00369 family)